MANRALCVGINDYPIPDMDLKGCVNDAEAWASALASHFDFNKSDVTVLLNKAATKKRIRKELDGLLRGASRGDVLVFTNSSHGTYIADTDGDEKRFDEAMCPWDCETNLLVDDELRELFDGLPTGVRLTVVSDSCHSGSVTRAAEPMPTPDDRRRRFMNPRLLNKAVLAAAEAHTARSSRREKRPESVMKEILVTGCTDRQYSFDAVIDGKYHGAMTFHALKALEEAGWDTTYTAWVARTNELVHDAEYEQDPQLEGKTAMKDNKVFR